MWCVVVYFVQRAVWCVRWCVQSYYNTTRVADAFKLCFPLLPPLFVLRYLRFGVNNISWKAISIFADAEVDADLDIDSSIKVELGKKIFHHCAHLGHKTVGVDVKSSGKNGIGINMTASNATIQKDSKGGAGYDLVFNFHADVVGLVLSWDVKDVTVNHCKIKILGIKIASYVLWFYSLSLSVALHVFCLCRLRSLTHSFPYDRYCGLLEKLIKNGVNKLSEKASRIVAPKLRAKLEAAINTAIGSVVRIPLKL